MKIEVAISSLLLFLLLLSSPSPAFSSEPVLDTNGDPVLTGSEYYLVSVSYGGASAGATMGLPRNGTCPLDVVRDRPLLDGLPVTLTLSDDSAEIGTAVQTSTSLKIEFTGAEAESVNTCQSSMEWSVGSNDAETGLRTITTDGWASVFTIEETGGTLTTVNEYKLGYCGASVCGKQICTADYVCRDVGESGRRLYAGGPAFQYVFRKA